MKKYDYIYKLIDALLLTFSGLPIFFIGWFFIQDVGSSLVFLPTFLPLYLSCLGLFYFYHAYHFCFFYKNRDKQKLALKGNGLTLSILGFIIVLLDVIFLSNGTYKGFIIDRATAIYPLDSFLLGFLFCIVGGLYSYFGFRKKEFEYGIKVGDSHVIFVILRTIFSLFASFFLGDFLISFVNFDRSFDNFFCCLSVYLLFAFIPFLEIFFVSYNEEKEGIERIKKGKKTSFIFSLIGLFLVAYFLIVFSFKPTFLSLSMVGNFPLLFMTSKMIGPLILCLLAILVPLGSYIYYFIIDYKNNLALAKEE